MTRSTSDNNDDDNNDDASDKNDASGDGDAKVTASRLRDGK